MTDDMNSELGISWLKIRIIRVRFLSFVMRLLIKRNKEGNGPRATLIAGMT